MHLGSQTLYNQPNYPGFFSIANIETNCLGISVVAVYGPRGTGMETYITEEMAFDGPSAGPRSLGELCDSDGRWACTFYSNFNLFQLQSDGNLNAIFFDNRIKWYYKPNVGLQGIQNRQ